jgi:hypothetical protein
MRKSRKWLLLLLCIVFLGWLFYAMTFQWLVPKTAAFAVPGKWNRVPLRKSKSIAHAWFGRPADSTEAIDTWQSGPSNKRYALRIYYIQDTVISSYSIRYTYGGRLLKKDYLIDSASIR